MPEAIKAGNEEYLSSGSDYFDPKEGETYRIAICLAYKDEDGNFDLAEKGEGAKFLGDHVYYLEDHPDYGYVQSTPYLEGKFEKPPKPRVGTVILEYGEFDNQKGEFPTDSDGKPDLNPDAWNIKPWVFGKDKFDKLSSIQKTFSLIYHDLLVTCKDEQFQKLEIQPAGKKEAIWRRASSDEKQMQFAKEAASQENQIYLGADPDESELKTHFGDDTGAPDASASVDDFDDDLDDIEI